VPNPLITVDARRASRPTRSTCSDTRTPRRGIWQGWAGEAHAVELLKYVLGIGLKTSSRSSPEGTSPKLWIVPDGRPGNPCWSARSV
jgi:hypothetical protein